MVNDKAENFKNAERRQFEKRHVSPLRRCSVNNSRAKQFLSFMALRGYEELLEEENENAIQQ